MIERGDRVFRQSLNYLGVPFRCNICHCYGHVISQCDLSLKRNFKYLDEFKTNKIWRVKKDSVNSVVDNHVCSK